MEQFRRSSDSTSSDLIPFAVAIHAILNGLAVKIRSQNNRGAQIETAKQKAGIYMSRYLKELLLRKT